MQNRLDSYLSQLKQGLLRIDEERAKILRKLSLQIKQDLEEKGSSQLNFICTHNSRRSHLAQVWAQVAAFHYGLTVQCYSGGTEATRIYNSTLEAIEKTGISIVQLSKAENPVFSLRYSDEAPTLICFSKTYDHEYNPSKGYTAIMTCSDAEENCPYIPRATSRIPITYRDPKFSDGTDSEPRTYQETCLLVATEMFYVMSKV